MVTICALYFVLYLLVAKFFAIFTACAHCWLQGRASCSLAGDWTSTSRIL